MAVHFKGSGFYNTDYGTAKRNRQSAASAESGADKNDAKQAEKKSDSSSSTRRRLRSSSSSSSSVGLEVRRISVSDPDSHGSFICAWVCGAATLGASMSARHVTLLAALSAIWGGSYLLIKYALDGFSAAMIVSAALLARIASVLYVVLRVTGLRVARVA